MEPLDDRHDSLPDNEKPGWLRRTLLILLPGIYALLGWLRLNGALTYWQYFTELRLKPGPLYLAITGGMIGLAFSLAFFLFIFKARIAGLYTRRFSWIFLSWFWVDRIFFSTREAFFNQLGISILISAITLIWAFLLIRKKDIYHPKRKEKITPEDDGEQT